MDLERMLDRQRWFFAKVSHDILPQDLNDLTLGLN